MPYQRERNAIQSSSRIPHANTHRFAIRFAYDGSSYQGFQSQNHSQDYTSTMNDNDTNIVTGNDCIHTSNNMNNDINHNNTIQDQMEHRISNLLKGRKVRILAWGRTDKGVSARGAVCTVDLTEMEVRRLAGGKIKSHYKHRKKLKKMSKQVQVAEASASGGHNAKDTDTGANANENTNTNTNTSDIHSITEEQLSRAANTICSALREFNCMNRPGSITARRCKVVPPTFDARFSCLWKRYVYHIACPNTTKRVSISSSHSHAGKDGGGGGGDQSRKRRRSYSCRSPFLARYAWQMDDALDLDAMRGAVAALNGRHHFEWASVVQEGEMRDPVRTLGIQLDTEVMIGSSLFCLESGGDDGDDDDGGGGGVMLVKISATCDFFLYKMMRRIAGTVVAVGRGEVDAETLRSWIEANDERFMVGGKNRDGDCPNIHTGGCSGTNSNHQKNAPPQPQPQQIGKIPKGLLKTAPANGLCLDHVEYDIPI